MNSAHRQADYSIRFEWGLSGAQAVAPGCELAVVVDILSFTTTLSVALDAGITVLPFRVRGDKAAAYAAEADAKLAVGRSVVGATRSACRRPRSGIAPSARRGSSCPRPTVRLSATNSPGPLQQWSERA